MARHQRLCLEALDEGGMRLLQRLLDKGCQDHVALHVDIFSDIKAGLRGPDTELDWCWGFAGNRAVYRPLIAYG